MTEFQIKIAKFVTFIAKELNSCLCTQNNSNLKEKLLNNDALHTTVAQYFLLNADSLAALLLYKRRIKLELLASLFLSSLS